MSAQKIPTEQKIPTAQKIPVDEEESGPDSIEDIFDSTIGYALFNLDTQLVNVQKSISQLEKILEEAWDTLHDLSQSFSERFGSLTLSQIVQNIQENKTLKNIEKNEYMILVRTENHPPDQVEIFIASPKIHSFQSHQAGRYSKKYDIQEKYMSADFYSKLQAELKICKFITDWNDRSKSFWCKKDTLPLVMNLIKIKIAEFRNSSGEQ